MREETIKLYQFDELSDRAKEKAREWYRRVSADDTFWHEHVPRSHTVIDDAADVLKKCGFDTYRRRAKLMNSTSKLMPAIYFTGFWSQGDGACFEASWSPESIMDHAAFCSEYPATWTDADGVVHRSESNEALQAIHAESVRLAALNPTRMVSWHCVHSGRYCHEHSVSFHYDDERGDGDDGDTENMPADIQEEHEENARDAMRWIYRQLEREWEWQNSNEQIDETIRANEYEFTEDGERH